MIPPDQKPEDCQSGFLRQSIEQGNSVLVIHIFILLEE
jgi:hypothetical protein